MTAFRIFHGLREFARECGDPQLGIVQANSKEEAEEKAAHDPIIASRGAGAGFWAVPVREGDAV